MRDDSHPSQVVSTISMLYLELRKYKKDSTEPWNCLGLKLPRFSLAYTAVRKIARQLHNQPIFLASSSLSSRGLQNWAWGSMYTFAYRKCAKMICRLIIILLIGNPFHLQGLIPNLINVSHGTIQFVLYEEMKKAYLAFFTRNSQGKGKLVRLFFQQLF